MDRRCLRYDTPANGLERAEALAVFLKNALQDCWREGSDMGEEERLGFLLCLDLLRDTLDICLDLVRDAAPDITEGAHD